MEACRVDDQALLSLGLWIKRRRRALDLTQDALATLVGCSKDLIVKIEGDARRPSREIAALLVEHLELAPEEREDFIRCARAEMAVDRLPSPTRSVPRPALSHARMPQAVPRHNLPAQLSSFLGREREMSELSALLEQPFVRLVTLTGTGGTGKTRLALHLAAAQIATYPDGVWFVDLAPISDPDLVVTTIAQTLGVSAASERATDQLKAALRQKQLLLVLDNYEQVLAAAPLVAELLAAAPGLTVLVTSRVVLHLSGEHEYAVPPLALPPTDYRPSATDHPGSHVGAETIGRYAAIQLFIARAQAAKANFAVTDTNAPAIAKICQRLDGLPLAIELAAARIKLFRPAALLEHLHQPLSLLTGGARDLPARQQTIRAAIDWSYHLLSSDEQRLFRRLGVFVGGFTLEAAAAIGAAEGEGTIDALAGLSTLLDHSLVVAHEPAGGEPRYRILETLREYALERLREAGEELDIRQQHAAYFVAWAEDIAARLVGADLPMSAQLMSELDNNRAALAWSLARPDEDVRYGLRLFACLWELWFLRYPREGRAIAERALACASASRQDLLAAQIYNAAARLLKNDWGDSVLLERSLALARQYDDRSLQAEVLRHLGEAMKGRDLQATTKLFEESLRISRELNDAEQQAWTTYGLGLIAKYRGDPIAAEHSFQHSLALFASLSQPYGQIFVLRELSHLAERRSDSAADRYLARALEFMDRLGPLAGYSPLIDRGRLACQRGDYQNALNLLRSGYNQVLQVGDDYSALLALMWQAVCHLELSDLATATELCRQAVVIALDFRDNFHLGHIAIILANATATGDKHITTARLLGCVDAYYGSITYQMEHDDETDWKMLHDEAMATCRVALSEVAFHAAWDTGQSLTLQQGVDEALAWLASLPSQQETQI
jgi:predicted ATPase/transcriptional regulator with XRE-family HTH domain